jgi:hypothetical protein
MSRIKTILSSSRLFSKGSKDLDGGVVDNATFNRMTASFESNTHLVDDVQFEYSAPLIFQINELKGDVDDLHTHLSESLYTNRETSFGGSILVSSHITASGNISSSGTLLGNSLTLGGTAITSTGTELNIVDGGTVASNITPQDADRVVYNDGGVMKQVTMTKLASYFDDEITNMPNLADIGTDLTVAGNITATSLNVTSITSSIVTSSILQTEGSNIFGDTIADTHTFNGHITASGNISSSGTGDNYFGGNLNIVNDSGTELNFTGTGNTNITTAGNLYVKAGSSKKIYFGANNTDSQVTIDTSGWVGIGDTSPNAPLDIESSENVLARFTSTDDDAKIIIEDDDTTGYHNVRNNYHSFGFDGYTTRSPLFVVSGSLENGVWGKVGIGTSAPGEVLTVHGNISASGFVSASAFGGDGSGLSNVSATVADESITLAKLAHAAANTVMVRDASDAGDPSFKAVTNTQILIGDGTGFTAAALSGDVTMTNAGVVSVADDKIGNDELKQDDDITLQSLSVTNHITASGNISASGTITGNAINVNGTNVLVAGGVDISADTNLAGGTGITLTGDTLSTTDSEIVHDNLSGFVANEHIDHSGVTMTAGAGLTGGGTIASTRTFNVDSASMGGFYSASMNDFTTTGFIKGNHITASGNISSSGTGNNILGGNLYFDGDTTISTVGGSDDLSINPDAELNLGTAGSDEINIGRQSGTCDINMFANTSTVAARFLTSTITFNHPVTASANISSSGTIQSTGNISTNGSITATSADINGNVDIDGGNLTVGTALQLTNGGVFNFGGSLADGRITWDTGYASLYGLAGNKLRLGSYNQQGVLTISSSTENVMVISASNVGIGTTSPERALEIKDTSNNHQLQLTAATNMNSGIKFTDGTDADAAHIYYYHTDKRLRFYTDNTEQMNILANGNVGIGTTAPTKPLQVTGDISASGTATIQNLNVFGPASGQPQIYINDRDNGLGTGDGFLITKSGTNAFIYNRDDGHLEIGTNDKQQLHIQDEAAEGQLKIADGGIDVTGHITASGNISSSGNIIADFPDTNDNALHYPLVTDGNTIEKLNDLNFNPSTGLVQVGSSLQVNSTNIVLGSPTGTISTTSHITAGGYISSSGAINTLSHITASGNISSSEYVYAERFIASGQVRVGGVTAITYSDPEIRFGYHTNLPIQIGKTITSRTNFAGHITASGNISSSGVIYGKQIQHTYHQFDNASNASVNYIPAPGAYVIEGTSINYYRKWLAPYKGKIKKIVIHAENDCGTTRVSLYTNGVFSGYHQQALGATTAVVFDTFTGGLSGNPNFNQHDLIAIAVDPANIPGEVNLVCSWEYEIDS